MNHKTKDILERIEDSSPNESSHELICRLRDCAHEIEALRAALASRSDAQADERYDLLQAAVNCPHEIESNRVVLHYSDKQPGHNALAQLRERLTRADAPQAEAVQGVASAKLIGRWDYSKPGCVRYEPDFPRGDIPEGAPVYVAATPSSDREQVGEAEQESKLARAIRVARGSSEPPSIPLKFSANSGTSPSRECGETKPAGPVDQAIYQAIADNYTRESAELGRPLSDFERVVLEYIAFNDGFINTRIRARQMLDGVGGERQGAALSDDARECLQDVVSHYGNFVEALTCKRDTVTTKTDREYWQHELSANARMKRQAEHALAASAPTLGEPVPLRDIRMLAGYAEGSKSPRMVNAFRRVMRWLDDAPAVAQPQAAEPKGMTEAIEALQCPETHSCSNPELFERGWEIGRDAALDIVRALLAKGE